MTRDPYSTQGTDSTDSRQAGFFLPMIILGSLILFAGFVLISLGSFSPEASRTSGAAVIIIGPLPLVFGSGPNVQFLLPFAVVLTIAAVAFFTLGLRRR